MKATTCDKVNECFRTYILTVYVVVHVWVGKEFPDMRQSERRIKCFRVGAAVRTAGRLMGELKPFTGLLFSQSVLSNSL